MKNILILLIAFLATGGLKAQVATSPVMLPGKGHINVEKLQKDIDFNMDISQLNVSELRVLRNAIPAQKGYCFDAAELRSVFNQTSWYPDVMYNRWENEEMEAAKGTNTIAPISYTAKESAFMSRLKARESQLLKNNYVDGKPNLDNLVNSYQVEALTGPLANKLAANGFAIVNSSYEQLFHVYEKNDYHDFPSFVTTDLYLQAMHLFSNSVIRKTEQLSLYPQVLTLCENIRKEIRSKMSDARKPYYKDALCYSDAWLSIAIALLRNDEPQGVAESYAAVAKEEIEKVMKCERTYSNFIPTCDYQKFYYDMFRPRGHYTRNDTLSCYFRGMMWLQSVPFDVKDTKSLSQALVLAEALDKTGLQQYKDADRAIAFLMGLPDNVAITALVDELNASGKTAAQIIGSKKALKALSKKMEYLCKSRTRIQSDLGDGQRCLLNFMPQRYMPDAEVLQAMVDTKTKPYTLRAEPSGLDVFAAMGNKTAQRILDNETTALQWSGFALKMSQMKALMDTTKLDGYYALRWLQAIKYAADNGLSKQQGTPAFMLTDAWGRKELNTALASWAELKHDALLYAKQPMGAECGDAGPPAPTVKGYVEPNLAFWKEAESVMTFILRGHVLSLDAIKMREAGERLLDMATFLRKATEKELAGRMLSKEEYDQTEYIGANFENISLDIVRDPERYLSEWSDVEGTDRNIALVADVYTANAINNPNPSVVYAGVGSGDEIYVVVEVQGYLYLMRGAVFSYREFSEPNGSQRLTDEEWQEKLKTQPRKGTPSWMKGISVPTTEAPNDNEFIFYGTGC